MQWRLRTKCLYECLCALRCQDCCALRLPEQTLLGLIDSGTRCQRLQRNAKLFTLKLICSLRKDLLDDFGLLLVKENVLLHLLEVNFVVKVYDVFRLTRLLVHDALRVNLRHIIFVLIEVCILIYYTIESDVA